MDLFVAGKSRKLIDAGLHIVTSDRLALSDRCQIDLLQHRLVCLNSAIGDLDPHRLLRAQHGEPQFTLEHDFVLGTPDLVHGGARVARRQHIGYRIGGHVRTFPLERERFKQ